MVYWAKWKMEINAGLYPLATKLVVTVGHFRRWETQWTKGYTTVAKDPISHWHSILWRRNRFEWWNMSLLLSFCYTGIILSPLTSSVENMVMYWLCCWKVLATNFGIVKDDFSCSGPCNICFKKKQVLQISD